MGMCKKHFILNDGVKDEKEFDENLLKDGKCLYEVIKVYKGVPLFLEKHLERLRNSAKLVNLNIWLSDEQIKNSINNIIDVTSVEKGSLKFVLNFKYKAFLCYFEDNIFPTDEDYKVGVKTSLYHKERVNPNAKVLNVDFRRDLDDFIKKENIFEAILVDRNSNITEGSKSNVFMVKDKKLITAPLNAVLPGTTRSVILDICSSLNIEVVEKYIKYDEIDSMDGIFLSSTPFDVLPVSMVGDLKFNSIDNEEICLIMDGYKNKMEGYVAKYRS